MPRKADVVLYDGDDMLRIAALRRAVDHAEDAARRARLASRAPLREGDESPTAAADQAVEVAKAAYDEFVREASSRADVWEVASIGHVEFRALLKSHPPRTELVDDENVEGGQREQVVEDDADFGVNTETFPMELLTFVDPEDATLRTITAPACASPEELRGRLKRLAIAEFDTLWIRAMGCNTAGVGDPKASLYSTASTGSTATSG